MDLLGGEGGEGMKGLKGVPRERDLRWGGLRGVRGGGGWKEDDIKKRRG